METKAGDAEKRADAFSHHREMGNFLVLSSTQTRI